MRPGSAPERDRDVGVSAGIRWGVIDQAIQVFARLAANVVLARILLPRDFGVVALAVVVVNLGLVLSGLGLGSALIQRRDLEDRHVTTAFTTSAVFGVVLALGVGASAWPAAAFFREEALLTLLPALGVTFVFRGLEVTPNDILMRQLRFRSYYLSSTIATVISCVAGLAAAAAGAGVWALVWMMVCESVLAAALAWWFAIHARAWRPKFGFDRRSFRELIGFSSYVTASQVVAYGNHNGDNLIVGRVLGATALGYYGFAYRLMILPLQRFGGIVSQSAFPALATVQHDVDRLRAGYVEATRYVVAVCFPITVGIAVASPLAVPILLGDRWRPAVPVLQILALSGPLLSLNRLSDALFRAIGKASWNFWLNLSSLAVHIMAFLIGVRSGVRGVAVAFVLATLAMIVPSLLLASRTLASPWSLLNRAVAPIAVATVAMALTAGGLVQALGRSGLSAPAQLVIVSGAGTAAYLVPLFVLAPDLAAVARGLIERRAPRSAP